MKKMFLALSLFSCLFLNLISSGNDLSNNNLDHILIPKDLSKIPLKDFQYQDSSTSQKLLSTMSAIPKELFKVAENVNHAVNAIANNIDIMLSKKGAIKTLVILTPMFMLYCYFFPPDLVKNLINYIIGSASQGGSEIVLSTVRGIRDNDGDLKLALKEITRELGELQGLYNVNYEIGQTAGLWQGLWDSPVSTITLLTTKLINISITAGVPCIAAIFANNWWKKTP